MAKLPIERMCAVMIYCLNLVCLFKLTPSLLISPSPPARLSLNRLQLLLKQNDRASPELLLPARLPAEALLLLCA